MDHSVLRGAMMSYDRSPMSCDRDQPVLRLVAVTSNLDPECPHCGRRHRTTCSLIKAIHYHSNGTVRTIEFHPPQPIEVPKVTATDRTTRVPASAVKDTWHKMLAEFVKQQIDNNKKFQETKINAPQCKGLLPADFRGTPYIPTVTSTYVPEPAYKTSYRWYGGAPSGEGTVRKALVDGRGYLQADPPKVDCDGIATRKTSGMYADVVVVKKETTFSV